MNALNNSLKQLVEDINQRNGAVGITIQDIINEISKQRSYIADLQQKLADEQKIRQQEFTENKSKIESLELEVRDLKESLNQQTRS